MKKISLLFATLVMIMLFSLTAGAATEGYYTYEIKNGEATITDVNTSISDDITIPATLGGYSVTTIGGNAFCDCESLTSVTIPDSVTTIGEGAFCECDSLTSVTIPDSVTTIGDRAFLGCESLTSITIPDSVTTIGDSAFYWCDSLASIVVDINNSAYSNDSRGVLFNKNKTMLIQYPTGNTGTSYTIPDSVTTIGDNAFYNCDSLTSITIPDSVTTIGEGAFCDCYRLTSVTIPDSVTTIGDYAFNDCDSLTSIVVDINNSAYSNDSRGVLFNKNKTMLIQYPKGNTGTSYTIPDSVTTIGDSAFYWCQSLQSVTIGDSVTSIGDEAFCGCMSLESVTIGDSVTSIGERAFHSCTSLASVTIPDSVTTIGHAAFGYCDSLQSVTIGDSVTSIGGYAFSNCKSLASVTIPDSVTSIGDKAFCDCKRLASVTIGDSVTSIGNYAFQNCTKLESVTIGDSVTSIGGSAFSGCASLTDVYYGGTEEQWNSIIIEVYNECLTGATIHFLGEEAHTHSYTSTVTKAASCTEAGVRTYTCSCGDSYTEAIPATGHADNNGDELCDACGEDLSPEEEVDNSFFGKIKAFFMRIIEWFRNLFR